LVAARFGRERAEKTVIAAASELRTATNASSVAADRVRMASVDAHLRELAALGGEWVYRRNRPSASGLDPEAVHGRDICEENGLETPADSWFAQ